MSKIRRIKIKIPPYMDFGGKRYRYTDRFDDYEQAHSRAKWLRKHGWLCRVDCRSTNAYSLFVCYIRSKKQDK